MRRYDWSVWLATTGGIGFLPWAPGTVAAAGGTMLAWALTGLDLAARVTVLLLLNVAGVWICGRAARIRGEKDPAIVVWDEMMTVPLTFAFVAPVGVSQLPILLTGFLLHRVCDLGKIPPARHLERLPGGWGIMADDWSAGLYSATLLWLLFA